MLRKDFELTRDQIDSILDHRDFQTGQTWYEFCRARGWTISEMLDGHATARRIRAKIEAGAPSPAR